MEPPGEAIDLTETERGFHASVTHRPIDALWTRLPSPRLALVPLYVAVLAVASFAGLAAGAAMPAWQALLVALGVALVGYLAAESTLPRRQESRVVLEGDGVSVSTEGVTTFAARLDRLAVETRGRMLVFTGESGRLALITEEREPDLELLVQRLRERAAAHGTSHDVPLALRAARAVRDRST
jgi:hypothetical protein